MFASAERVTTSVPGRVLRAWPGAVVSVVLALTGCGAGRAADTLAPGPTTAYAKLDDPRGLLLTAPVDAPAGAADGIRAIRGNLQQLEVTAVDTGRTSPLPPERRSALGPTAAVHGLSVTTAWAGERFGVTHTVWVTTTRRDGRDALAGFGDGPRDDAPIPLWALGPISVTRGRHVALVTADARPAGEWVAALDSALDAVTAAGVRGDGPPGLVVAELPRDVVTLSRLVDSGTLDRVGAASWPFGAGDRVLINPEYGAATSGEARDFLLCHELVHTVTRSSHAQTWPRWFVEGYADAVAARIHPVVGEALNRELAAALRAGAPVTLPEDADLDPTRTDVSVGYGRARVAVTALGDAAAGIQARLSDGVPFDVALHENGWTRERLQQVTATELTRLKESQ